MDFCGSFVVLFVLIGVVTLLGHGIWVLLAQVFSAARGHKSPDRWVSCPACGQSIPSWKKSCPRCGLENFGAAAQELTDLAATARQLQRFSNEGILSPSELDRLSSEIRARQRHLMGLPEPATAQPDPAEVIPIATVPSAPALPAFSMRAVEIEPAAGVPHSRAWTQRPAERPAEEEILDVIPIEIEPDVVARSPDRATPVVAWSPDRATGPTEGLHLPPAAPALPVIAEQPQEPLPPPVPPKPRRSLAELFATFMEEKNILWGELLGGLLIVGCSIALVISLWQQVEKIPYYPFIIVGTITAALFGAGLYTLHHWKLESTSRGLLVIATLLVPLNFLVVAGLHRGDPGRTAADLVTELGVTGVFVAVFFALLKMAGPVLTPGHRWLLPLAVLGTSASQLLVSGMIHPEQLPALGLFMLLGFLPTAVNGLSIGRAVRQTARQEQLEERPVKVLLGFLGIASFSLMVTLGFQAYRAADLATALHWLAPLVALAGVGPLAIGALAHCRLADSGQAATRVTGTIVALLGVCVMLAAIGLAWPLAWFLVLVCAINLAVLTGVAFRRQMPILHVAAVPCLALGYLTAFHSVVGNIDGDSGWSLLRAIVSSRSGTALAVLVALLGVAAEAVSRLGLRRHGAFYALGAALLAAVSLAMVTSAGREDPLRATIIYGLFGVGSLALNSRWRRTDVGYLGVGLLLGAVVWCLPWNWPERLPIWSAVFAIEALLLAGLRAFGGQVTDETSETPSNKLIPSFVAQPLAHWALISGCLGLGFGIVACWAPWPGHWSTVTPWLHGLTAASLAAAALLLAWVFRGEWLTWLGSALILNGLAHAFIGPVPSDIWTRDLLTALLAHVTLVGASGLLLRKRLPHDSSSDMVRFYAEPLQLSALLTSLIAVPLLALPFQGQMLNYAGLTLWLAGFWLVIACVERWPVLLAAFQAAVFVAAGYALTAWLEQQPFASAGYPQSLWDPWSLQGYGIGLGLLTLVWIAVRIGLRNKASAQELLATPWTSVDRIVLAVLIAGQLALALWGIWPSVAQELTPLRLLGEMQTPGEPFSHAFGPAAWALLGILSLVLVAGLWERCTEEAILGLVILAVTVPVLVAARYADIHATVPAWRWGIGACFLLASVPLWLREPLGNSARRLGLPLPEQNGLALTARWSLLFCCMVPVLVLTAIAITLRLGGEQLLKPDDGTFFREIGSIGSYGVPLVLVGLALVGHALRERMPGYAFAAGLIAAAVVMGGHALHVVRVQATFTQADLLRLVQLGTIAAGVWALAWLTSRRWLAAWREDALFGRALMSAQFVLLSLGNALLLVGGLGSLVGWFPRESVDVAQVYYVRADWAAEVGSLWTWLALGLAAAGGVYRSRQQGSSLAPWTLGSIGLGTVALVACSIERWTAPGWGYRIVMLGSAAFALGWAAFAAKRSPADTEQSSRHGKEETVVLGVVAAGLFAVLLGLKAAIWHHDHLFAAAAIGFAAAASAMVAVWRRREEWALVSGLLMGLAASFVVWHFHLGEAVSEWWFYLLQANSAAGGLAALIWLGARKRIYGDLELRLSASPLLATQIALTFLCNLVWLGLAFIILVVVPDGLAALAMLGDFGGVGGSLAVLLPMAAGLSYAAQAAPRSRLPVAVLHSLAFGILAACIACRWDTGNWLGFHVLQIAWSTVGLLTLALGIVTVALAIGQAPSPEEDSEQSSPTDPSWLARLLTFPEAQAQRWVEIIGCLVVLLVLRGAGSTAGGAYWSPAVAVTVTVMAIGLALWSRKPRFVYESGLLLNLVGNLFLLTQPAFTFLDFVSVNALCLALGSTFWSALELAFQTGAAPLDFRGRSLAYNHVAALLGVVILGTVLAWIVVADLTPLPFGPAGWLMWVSLAATGIAVLLGMRDPRALLGTGGLYLIGLCTVALLLHGQQTTLALHLASWSLALASYLLFSALMTIAAERFDWKRLLGIVGDEAASTSSLLGAQIATSFVVAALALWVSLDTGNASNRVLGPLATALLIPAGIALTRRSQRRLDQGIPYATLALVVIACGELGWAMLPVDIALPWLHRHVLLLTASVVMAAVYAEMRDRLAEKWPLWAAAARHLRVHLVFVAFALLLIVLTLEAASFNPAPDARRAPVTPWAVAVIALALLGMIVTMLRWALRPQHGPWQLSDERRTTYVYTAEVSLALLFCHIKLTVPFAIGPYWTFMLMAVAFAGVGLSELCKRRGLSVLAGPLQHTGIFLPVFPLVAIWVRPAAETALPWAERTVPGAQPFLLSFTKVPQAFDQYAALWLLTGVLLSLVALSRKSFRFAFLAALAGNFALWSMWHHTGMSFLVHPQLWLIPIAVVLLVAEHLNRDRLSAVQSLNIRYAALGMIYLSSTADMFIAGLGNSVGLPLWLMVLSIAGVLLGIMLEVRAYLFLGIGFLCLDIFSMIWNAAVNLNHTWVWWASGIVLGIAILSLFAVFEKRRNDVLLLLEQIKGWR